MKKYILDIKLTVNLADIMLENDLTNRIKYNLYDEDKEELLASTTDENVNVKTATKLCLFPPEDKTYEFPDDKSALLWFKLEYGG